MKGAPTKIREGGDRHAKEVVRRNRGIFSLEEAHAAIDAGDALSDHPDDREDRLAIYREAFAFYEELAATDPGNAKWQNNVAVGHDRIGGVLFDQGNIEAALDEFRKSFAIREKLAEADPGNAEWQHTLSVNHDRFGDVLRAQGDAKGALREYRKSLAIRALAATLPSNIAWRRNLAVSHHQIGDVLLDQDEVEAALGEFRKCFDITAWLAKADPGNIEWRRDLAISHERIGYALLRQGKGEAALREFQWQLDVVSTLAAADRDNAEWQHELREIFEKIKSVKRLFGIGESNTDVDLGSAARDDPNIVDDLTAYFAVARRAFEKGVSVAQLDEAIEKLAAKAAARETTTARANESPRPEETVPSIETAAAETTKPKNPHWKDVRQPGEELGDFIKREFAPELADGTMMRPLLKRYRGLHEAFYNHLDKLPPELQAIPTKSVLNDQLVAEGKVTDLESIRSAARDRGRIKAAHRRAVI
jgi:tetratricopeptide (TPR) repeat protein